ncbi:MAG: hypothetical protein BWY77_01366 [bacterium ADurb.Bin431]|nr:MAG: hypothetical protein BWY77_01366 [bacterium ADurb.Bin431]HNY91389.1 hypothetical protein [bacterium]HOH08237.1 hypothetical protein [bacterium]HOY43742.1 hypothetical protein [bacterium]HPG84233.1 hypothetical protein [bacterium]
MTEFCRIVTLKNEIEAQVLAEALREREIPHVVRTFHDSAYDGIFQMQKGWGVLMAPESFRAEIETILNELNAG